MKGPLSSDESSFHGRIFQFATHKLIMENCGSFFGAAMQESHRTLRKIISLFSGNLRRILLEVHRVIFFKDHWSSIEARKALKIQKNSKGEGSPKTQTQNIFNFNSNWNFLQKAFSFLATFAHWISRKFSQWKPPDYERIIAAHFAFDSCVILKQLRGQRAFKVSSAELLIARRNFADS